jgi:hypothetical protein
MFWFIASMVSVAVLGSEIAFVHFLLDPTR